MVDFADHVWAKLAEDAVLLHFLDELLHLATLLFADNKRVVKPRKRHQHSRARGLNGGTSWPIILKGQVSKLVPCVELIHSFEPVYFNDRVVVWVDLFEDLQVHFRFLVLDALINFL